MLVSLAKATNALVVSRCVRLFPRSFRSRNNVASATSLKLRFPFLLQFKFTCKVFLLSVLSFIHSAIHSTQILPHLTSHSLSSHSALSNLLTQSSLHNSLSCFPAISHPWALHTDRFALFDSIKLQLRGFYTLDGLRWAWGVIRVEWKVGGGGGGGGGGV